MLPPTTVPGIAKRLARCVALGGLVVSCGPAPGHDVIVPSVVRFEMQSLERSLPGCAGEREECTRVVLTYPDVQQAPGGAAARTAMNARIAETTLRSTSESEGVLGPDALVTEFFDDYVALRAEQPDYSFDWVLERNTEVTLNAPGVFSVRTREYSFTGGAHPNSYVRLLSLDPGAGERLSLGDLFAEDFEGPLRALAEVHFRAERGIAAEASLLNEGLWFEDDVFRLNENYSVGSDGLRFYYNNYEVAPYAFGPTEILVSSAALAALVRKDGPLAALWATTQRTEES